jgi:pyruvate dehydrogenase E2 component (dihydrolipoamide acetyltransferase)
MTEIIMPQLGETVSEGTITTWLRKVGDSVQLDDPLVEIATDKVDTEIVSTATGMIAEILVPEGQTVPVGTPLARLAVDAESLSPEDEASVSAAAPHHFRHHAATREATAPGTESVISAGTTSQDLPSLHTRLSPLVRRLAHEKAVDLAQVTGTGRGGRIRKRDVLAAASQASLASDRAATTPSEISALTGPRTEPPATPSAVESREPLSRVRKVIGKRMLESLQTSAQLTTVTEADVTRVARLRARFNTKLPAGSPDKFSFLPFFARAAIEALGQHPLINARIDGDDIVRHEGVDLSIAVDTERGLMVPVIRRADRLNLMGLRDAIGDLATRAREGNLINDELSGGTFTLTNTGSRGALFDTPIINQPQAAILGTGAVVRRPAVIDHPELGEVWVARSVVYLALSYDHRLIDGADAARFLETVRARLETAQFEAELGLV